MEELETQIIKAKAEIFDLQIILNRKMNQLNELIKQRKVKEA